MNARAARTLAALLFEAAAIVLLALVVIGRPWPSERSAANVYVLADRSASVAADDVTAAVSDVATHVLGAGAAADFRLIDFAGHASESRRLTRPADAKFSSSDRIETQQTNIEDALLRSMSAGTARPSAVVVISDGNATAGDTERGLHAAADAGVPVFWRTIGPDPSHPRIVEVLAPREARPGQDIPVAVRLAGRSERALTLKISPHAVDADSSNSTVASGELGTVASSVRAKSAGTLLLDVSLSESSGGHVVDARPSAVAIDVEAPAEILYVAAGPRPFSRSLVAGGWRLESIPPPALDAKARGFDRYAAVVLDDVPASAARPETWTALADSVRRRGTGLLVLGGEQSFAAGSYRDSRLEEVLPVVSRPGALGDAAAVVFVVDKSGSMGASAAGVDRFRLAQRAVVETAATLTDRDSAGLVVFDVEARDLLPLQEAKSFRVAVSHPWPAQPRGGTRLGPALDAALKQLQASSAPRRLLVLVTDGFVNEAAEPALRQRLSQARVELVALGVGPDADVAALGRIFPSAMSTILHVGEAAELPEMMRRGLETRRAPIERGRIVAHQQRPLPFLATQATWPAVAAYDVTMPAASAVVYVASERGDPLIAYGPAGLGRVVVVTSGLGAWTPDWLRWQQWPALAGGLVEWVSSSNAATDIAARVTDLPRSLRIDVEAARQGQWRNADEGRVLVQHPSGRVAAVPLTPSLPGRSTAEIEQPESGLYSITVEMPGVVRHLVHLRQPRRELASVGPSPEIAAWQRSGLVRDWSPAEIARTLEASRPVEPRPSRAILLALMLFLLGLVIDRVRGK